MHLVDPWANLSRWREHPVEVMTFSFGLLVLALVLPTVPCAPVILVTSALGITLGARIPLRVYLQIMIIPLTFLIFGSVALIFSVTTEGGWAVRATDEGLRTAGIVFLRSLSAVSAMMMLAMTVPMGEILSLLRRWHVPSALTELMGLMYRLIFVFDRTLHAMIRAQGCRLGFRNLRTSYRSFGAIVAALFLRTVDRAHRMEMGLAARGYTGELRVLSCRHAVSLRAIGLILLTHASITALGLLWLGVIPWPI